MEAEVLGMSWEIPAWRRIPKAGKQQVGFFESAPASQPSSILAACAVPVFSPPWERSGSCRGAETHLEPGVSITFVGVTVLGLCVPQNPCSKHTLQLR